MGTIRIVGARMADVGSPTGDAQSPGRRWTDSWEPGSWRLDSGRRSG
jgi:hypothetical protein